MSQRDYPEVDYKEIKRWLEHGDISRLAAQENISFNYASDILAGRKRKMSFIKAAQELAIANKARITAGQDKLKRIPS